MVSTSSTNSSYTECVIAQVMRYVGKEEKVDREKYDALMSLVEDIFDGVEDNDENTILYKSDIANYFRNIKGII